MCNARFTIISVEKKPIAEWRNDDGASRPRTLHSSLVPRIWPRRVRKTKLEYNYIYIYIYIWRAWYWYSAKVYKYFEILLFVCFRFFINIFDAAFPLQTASYDWIRLYRRSRYVFFGRRVFKITSHTALRLHYTAKNLAPPNARRNERFLPACCSVCDKNTLFYYACY